MTTTKFFPNSATLFTQKDKKSEKSPDLTGNIMLGPDLVTYIIEQHDSGNFEITLDLAAWKKVSAGGNKFLSGSIKKPFVKDGSYTPGVRKVRSPSTDSDDDMPF